MTGGVGGVWEASEGAVDGGGNLRREGVAGEGEFDQNVIKTKKSQYLHVRGTTVELWDTSASKLVLGNGDSPAAVSLGAEGKGRRRGLGSGFYRWTATAYKEGERGALIGYLPCRCGGPAASIRACAITGMTEGKRRGEEGKGRVWQR